MNLQVLDADECRKVGITDPEQVHQGVLRFKHTKASYGPKQRDKYLLRLEGGYLEKFEPDFAADSPEALLAALRRYFDKHPKQPLTLSAMERQKRVQIFGKTVPRRALANWLRLDTEHGGPPLKEVGKNKAGNASIYQLRDDDEQQQNDAQGEQETADEE
jgi:hypothetical protein